MINRVDVSQVVVQFLTKDGRKRKHFKLKQPISRGEFIDWKMKNEHRKGVFSILGCIGNSNSHI